MADHDLQAGLEAVRRALAARDLREAAHHLARALTVQPQSREVLELLGEFQDVAGVRALGFAALEKDSFHGTAALRAWLLQAEGRTAEAVPLLLRVQAAAPDVPYALWLESWLEDSASVEGLDGELVASAAQGVLGSVDLAAPGRSGAALGSVLSTLRRVQAAHPESSQLFFVTCVALRRAGFADEAERLAEQRRRTNPDYFASVALAGIHRDQGEFEEALQDFQTALGYLPEDVGARLDIGDLSLELGRLPESLHAYEQALLREPENDWALPSASYVRWLLFREREDREELRAFAHDHPDNERAQELLQKLERWVRSLPTPASSLEAFFRAEALPRRVWCSALEAPSAVLVLQRLATARGGECSVEFPADAVPDPREPLEPVQVSLWRYQGPRVESALPLGDPAVGESLASIAEEPYDLGRWWEHAGQVARQLGDDAAPQVLAAMVDLPVCPDRDGWWEWPFQIQVAAALVLARMERRREVLFDLAVGPVDWASTAALIALSELGRRDERLLPLVTRLFFRLLEVPPCPVRSACWTEPLVELAERLPRLSAAQKQLLDRLRREQRPESDGEG